MLKKYEKINLNENITCENCKNTINFVYYDIEYNKPIDLPLRLNDFICPFCYDVIVLDFKFLSDMDKGVIYTGFQISTLEGKFNKYKKSKKVKQLDNESKLLSIKKDFFDYLIEYGIAFVLCSLLGYISYLVLLALDYRYWTSWICAIMTIICIISMGFFIISDIRGNE